MGADRVNFLFMDKEAVAGFMNDGGSMIDKVIGMYNFKIAIPDFIDMKKQHHWDFVPRFRLIRDVDLEECFGNDFWVWPIRTNQTDSKFDFQKKGKLFMLLQVEKNKSDLIPFNNDSDSKFLQEISKIIYQAYCAITVTRKVDSSKVRAFKILNDCKFSC